MTSSAQSSSIPRADDEIDYLNVFDLSDLLSSSPVRCGTYRTPTPLSKTEIAREKLFSKQVDKLMAGKKIKCSDELLLKIKRAAIQRDLELPSDDEPSEPVFI